EHDKRAAACNAPSRFVPQPADVDGELMRFGAGKQHAKIQRVQKTCVVDPAFFLDQLGMHHRDLPTRSAEGYEAELQPKSKRLGERRCNLRMLPSNCLS